MRLFLILLCLAALPAFAQESPTPAVVKGDFGDLKHTGSARIDKVIDGQTVMMQDGKIVRLLGLDYPYVNGDAENPYAVAGKDLLQTLINNKTEVMLYQTRNIKAGRMNRMGHVLAHLVVKGSDLWVNGALVASGDAFAVTDDANPEMATQLYTLENQARAKGLGLWNARSPSGLLTPDTASQGDGQFRVVEGTVDRAALNHNNLYLNFGHDWKKDFTVMLSPEIRRTLSHRGTDPMFLSGKHVRVRGWIREWNGPYMELETPERLEILETLPAAASNAAQQEPQTSPETPAEDMQTGQDNP